jgi:hypothetical protein
VSNGSKVALFYPLAGIVGAADGVRLGQLPIRHFADEASR